MKIAPTELHRHKLVDIANSAFKVQKMWCWQKIFFTLLQLIAITNLVKSYELTGQSIKDALVEYSLLNDGITPMLPGVEFELADDGFPALKFSSEANVVSFYKLSLPERLYEFALMLKFRPSSPKGGYLFSVVNSLDTIVQLGLYLSPASKNMWNVSLLYASHDSLVNRKLVSYQLPYDNKKWTTLAFQVLNDKVLYYYDCDLKETTEVKKEPSELIFDSASKLYIAQGGSKLEGHFEIFQKSSKHLTSTLL